jgi:hypothetical protein
MSGNGSDAGEADNELALDREIEIGERALGERGAANRRELARRVGARYWGQARTSAGHEHDSRRPPAEG